jgi:hypothetical protein
MVELLHGRADQAAEPEQAARGGLHPREELGLGIGGHGRELRRVLLRVALHGGDEQALLAPEPAEQGDLVDAGLLRDAPGGGAAETFFHEDAQGGLEDALVGGHGAAQVAPPRALASAHLRR